jgi:methyl-accepting chemotaxis protein
VSKNVTAIHALSEKVSENAQVVNLSGSQLSQGSGQLQRELNSFRI